MSSLPAFQARRQNRQQRRDRPHPAIILVSTLIYYVCYVCLFYGIALRRVLDDLVMIARRKLANAFLLSLIAVRKLTLRALARDVSVVVLLCCLGWCIAMFVIVPSLPGGGR